MRHVRRFALAVVALALIFAGAARAQVLQLVPSEALVVIKIKNLQDVSQKVAMLSQQWGLANIRPELNDPLGTLLTAGNLGPGLNKSGEAAVAIMKSAVPGQNEPDVLVLVPVSDYKAFATALPNGKPEGDLTTFSPGGQPMYASDWGKFAAVSQKKELLAKKGNGIAVTGVAAKELDAKDLIAYANLKVIRNDVLPLIQQNREKFLNDINKAMANAPGANPKYAPVLKTYMGQFVNAIEEFLKDADAATFGINLTKDGISTTLMAEFDPASYFGKGFGQMKNSDASFTRGLPDGKYFVYGGFVVEKSGIQMFNDFVEPIEKELQGMGADGKPILDYITAAKDYMGAAKQANFGMVAPPAAAFGQQGVIQLVGVIQGDSAKITEAIRRVYGAQGEVMKLTGFGGMGATEVKAAAKTVDGVQLDQFTTSFKGNPQTPQEQQVAFLMQMLYGPQGMVAYAGALAPDKTISVVGVSDALLASAIQAAKADNDPVGKGVAAKVAAALPQNRLAAFYVPIDTIASTILDVMAARGMPGGVKLPPNLPPIGGAISTDGTAVRADGYIPAQTVQALIAAGMQMWLQQQGGAGPGQPGGL